MELTEVTNTQNDYITDAYILFVMAEYSMYHALQLCSGHYCV